MQKYLTIFILFTTLAIAKPTKIEVFTTQHNFSCDSIVINEKVFLPLDVMEAKFAITVKPISEKVNGVCYGELCIPYDKESGHFYKTKHRQFLCLQHLIESIGGVYIWDNSETLLLDFSSNSTLQSNKETIDFQLLNMQGVPVRLSDFHGRKVIVFAWASW